MTSRNSAWGAVCAAVVTACGGGAPPTLWLDDDANYSFSGEMSADAWPIAPQQNVQISWSDLTVDIRGRTLDPSTDIGELVLVSFYMPQTELMQALAENDLLQSDIQDYRIFENVDGLTTTSSSEFSVVGNPFDASLLVESATSTWTVVTMHGAGTDADVASLAVLTPTDGETNSDIVIDNESASLDFTADLHSATQLTAEPDTLYTLDWSGITEDANGHTLTSNTVDRLTIGHVLNDEIGELEEQFVQLLELAATLYRMDVYGRDSLALEELTDESGAPFTGFTNDGTWLIALECPACLSPAPLVLTAVDVQ